MVRHAAGLLTVIDVDSYLNDEEVGLEPIHLIDMARNPQPHFVLQLDDKRHERNLG